MSIAAYFLTKSNSQFYTFLTDYQDWMVVTAVACANMREGPSLDSPVITGVKYGMQVKAVARHGEWIKARPVGPGSVDPRFERRTGYIHQSLLMTC
jgi:uncharacterized protein YgiM (DUF1202 family)